MALPSLSVIEQVEALYVAYYGRAGEPDGVTYWRSLIEAGRTFAEVAAAFSTQAESRNQHAFFANPANSSPADFIESLYSQLLGRSSDADGFAYWTAQLAAADGNPFRIGILIAQFISGASSENGDAATILNKIEAAEYFTSELAERGMGGTLNGSLLEHQLQSISRSAVDNDITASSSTIAISRNEIDNFLTHWTGGFNTIERVSLGNNWQQANDGSISRRDAVSADGRYIIFESAATNLGENHPDRSDIFIRDLILGETHLVSAGLNTTNHSAGISDNGLTVTFVSTSDYNSSNLSYTQQIFSWTQRDGLQLVNHLDVEGGNSRSDMPVISGDGNVIGFVSYSKNFDPRDQNNFSDIYLYSGPTTPPTLVSFGGVPSNGNSVNVALSRDGSVAAFESTASNLIPGSTIEGRQIYFWNGSEIELVSRSGDGTPGNGDSSNASISSDGKLIVYSSTANNLLNAGIDPYLARDVFLFDVRTGQTSLINVTTDGDAARGGGFAPDISGDGRFVTFASNTSDIDGEAGVYSHIFVRDLALNETHLVSRTNEGVFGNGESSMPSISEDGRYITFYSRSSNLVYGDTNEAIDVFVVDGFAQGWWHW